MTASLINKIITDDFMWSAILRAVRGKTKVSGTRFLNFNCPMCVTRGYSSDKRGRCGVKFEHGRIGAHCFNCGFKLRWDVGTPLSRSMETFLDAMGVPEIEIRSLRLRAFSHHQMLRQSPEALELVPSLLGPPHFDPVPLPIGARALDAWANENCLDPDFLDAAAYIQSRGQSIFEAATYYWTPATDHGLNRRIIVPMVHEGRIVGWTARAVDPGASPRYYNQTPAGFLFNNDVLTKRHWVYAILVEGIFDALAVDGVATMGARLNDRQVAWLKASGKTVIVVPDRDEAGQRTIDLALKQNWKIAMPRARGDSAWQEDDWWDADVKDAADAVKRYGKLYTVQSIIATATDNKIKINIKRKFW